MGVGWAIGTANHAAADTSQTQSTTSTTESSSPSTSSTPSQSSPSSSPSASSSESSDSSAQSTESESSSTEESTQSSSESGVSGSFTGKTASQRYGTVTVTIEVENGKITDVSAETTVREQRSQQYVNRALPTLRTEVLEAQSADISSVSGATYTSESYITSLQSALDEAGL